MTRRQGYVAIVQHLQDIHAHHQHELNASGRHMVRRCLVAAIREAIEAGATADEVAV